MARGAVVVEACVTSAAEAESAVRAGARRLEVCRDLHTGGLTPPRGLASAVRAVTGLPMFVLLRPRPGGFVARPGDGAKMLAQIDGLRTLGAEGLVLGVLDRTSRIDETLLRELVAAAGGLSVTFHRAFDGVPDPVSALERLAAAGVKRVLTSGGAATAWAGRETLRDLVRHSRGRVTILAGGAIRADHVCALVDFAGLEEVHARASAIPGIVTALQRPAA